MSVLRVTDPALEAYPQPWALRSASVRGQLLDVSISSVSLLSSMEFEAGEHVLLEIKHPRREFSVVRRATVVSCTAKPADGWKTVCRLQSGLSVDEVTQLGSFWVLSGTSFQVG